MQLHQLPCSFSAIRGRSFLSPLWPASKSRRTPSYNIVTRSSLEEEEAQFELDGSEAREALRRLDEQLQGLSEPKKRPPSTPLPEPYVDRVMITGKGSTELPEFSPSYIAYTAVALVILTIFNNVMFSLYIKPSVDGNEQAIKIERVPLTEPTERQFP